MIMADKVGTSMFWKGRHPHVNIKSETLYSFTQFSDHFSIPSHKKKKQNYKSGYEMSSMLLESRQKMWQETYIV